jgi:predicted NUDIX family phosphoesterase
MHKTLAARLAEHIRQESSKSKFFRTAPAKFYLHSLAATPGQPTEFTTVYIGDQRSKKIRKENVLVAPKVFLNMKIFGEYVAFNENEFKDLYREHCKFVDRSTAELDDSIKQFVTFTLVLHESKILVYRRGRFTTTSDTLKGQMSVGFGGHVNDSDFDLFNVGSDAFKNNAARELKEELFLDNAYRHRHEAANNTRVLGYINVEDSPDAAHHIAVLVAFFHNSPSLPKKGELSINQLAWLDLDSRPNDLSEYDLWSSMILRNIVSGKIKVSRDAAHSN